MADGVLTSSLKIEWCKLFFGMQALPKKTGGHVLTVGFGLQEDDTNMISNGKIMWTKVMRLVETSNFDFWIISIQDHMQILKPKYCKSSSKAIKSTQPRTVSMLWRKHGGNELEILKSRFSSFWSIKMGPNGKTHNMKVLRLDEANNFVFYDILIWDRLLPQIWQIRTIKTGRFRFNSNIFQYGQV